MRAIILTIIALLVLPDIYISTVLLRGTWWRILCWLPTIAMMILTAAFMRGHNSQTVLVLLFGAVLCIGVPKLILCICSLAGRAAGLIPALSAAPRAGDTVGCVLAAAVAAISIFSMTAGRTILAVKRTTMEFEQLPEAFDGYRIVHFSDLHAGSFGRSTRFMSRLAEAINAEQADAVMFTGDIINSSFEELEPFGQVLAQLRARDGIYSVTGNHDYSEYHRWPTRDGAARSLELVKRAEREAGWNLLLNEHRIITRGGEQIAIIGVENVGRPPFPSKGDLRKALDGLPENMFKVLLSHDPTHWRAEVLPQSDVALMLAGHTHAMQFRLGGFSPSAWTYDEWGGEYDCGGRKLYVSTGTGGTAPFRFGAWPCIDVITLKRKS